MVDICSHLCAIFLSYWNEHSRHTCIWWINYKLYDTIQLHRFLLIRQTILSPNKLTLKYLDREKKVLAVTYLKLLSILKSNCHNSFKAIFMYKCNGIYCVSLCNNYLAISHGPYRGFRPTTLNRVLLCDIMHPH